MKGHYGPPREYLTVNEVAARLRVSRMTVYRLVNTGELASYRVGNQIRVTPEDLRLYLEENRRG